LANEASAVYSLVRGILSSGVFFLDVDVDVAD